MRATPERQHVRATATVQHGLSLRAVNGQGFVAEQTLFAPDFSILTSTQGFAE